MPINVALTWKKVWSIAGFLATVIGVTIYLTWEIRKDYIEDLKNQIAVFNQSESWKLPDTLKKLNSVSEKLQSQLADAEELKKLRTEVSALEETNKKAATSLADATNKAEQLSVEVVSLKTELRRSLTESSQFKLREGQTAELVKNQVVFGVSAVASGLVLGYLNNESVTLRIAGYLPVRFNDEICKLTLIQTENPVATVSFSCPRLAEKT